MDNVSRLRYDFRIHEAAARALHKESVDAHSFSTRRPTEEQLEVAWMTSQVNRSLWIERARVALQAAADVLEKEEK